MTEAMVESVDKLISAIKMRIADLKKEESTSQDEYDAWQEEEENHPGGIEPDVIDNSDKIGWYESAVEHLDNALEALDRATEA